MHPPNIKNASNLNCGFGIFRKTVFGVKLQRKSSPFCQQVLIALSETWHLGVTLLTARVINFNQRGGEGMINY